MASEEEYRKAAEQSVSLSDMCRYFNILPLGGNMDTMKHKIALYNIDVSHFVRPVKLQENHGKPFTRNIQNKQILVDKFGYKCSECGLSEYNGQYITLQVDHVDGNNTNDKVSNLRLLCPNCHYETDTYTGRKRDGKLKKTICECGDRKSPSSQKCASCFKIDTSIPIRISEPKKYTKDILEPLILSSTSFAEVKRKLGLKGGGSQSTIKNAAFYYGIDFSHFTGQSWNKNLFSEIPTGKETWKKKLIYERGHQCENCERTHWVSGNLIPLELEHIDGNNKNNVTDNLKLLCPNCHSQTKTWKRKKSALNKAKNECLGCGKYLPKKSKRCLECYNEYRIANTSHSGKVSNARDYNPKYNLCACGEQKLAKSPQCVKCAKKGIEKIDWPDANELIEMVNASSYVAVAKSLGVSDNALRKRIRRGGVDAPVKLANRYLTEDHVCACGETKKPESKTCNACYKKDVAYAYPEDTVLIEMINNAGSIIKVAHLLGVSKSSIHKRIERRKLKQYIK